MLAERLATTEVPGMTTFLLADTPGESTEGEAASPTPKRVFERIFAKC